nr:hypothetical protein [Cellulosimicrobium sp. CUA-896]
MCWRDRDLRFHECDRKRPTRNDQSLLDHAGSHDDPILWWWTRQRVTVPLRRIWLRHPA